MKSFLILIFLSKIFAQNANCSCGPNAICIQPGKPPICSCPFGFEETSELACKRLECRFKSDCRTDEACKNGKCVNLCQLNCGLNAQCHASGHSVACFCPPGLVGDAKVQCRPFHQTDVCRNDTCGPHSVCHVINQQPVCVCETGFMRSAESKICIPECETDIDCSSTQYCENFHCKSLCSRCGTRAICSQVDTEAKDLRNVTCECPKDFIGDPYVSCRPECTTTNDCPRHRPLCRSGVCYDPCENFCGIDAICTSNYWNGTTTCFCPEGRTGNPYDRCFLIEPKNPCETSPCGKNATCSTGFMNGEICAICHCPKGLRGDPNRECVEGDCDRDGDCLDSQACEEWMCKDPCKSHKCGVDATCTVRDHSPICTCPTGFEGNPHTTCVERKNKPILL